MSNLANRICWIARSRGANIGASRWSLFQQCNHESVKLKFFLKANASKETFRPRCSQLAVTLSSLLQSLLWWWTGPPSPNPDRTERPWGWQASLSFVRAVYIRQEGAEWRVYCVVSTCSWNEKKAEAFQHVPLAAIVVKWRGTGSHDHDKTKGSLGTCNSRVSWQRNRHRCFADGKLLR